MAEVKGPMIGAADPTSHDIRDDIRRTRAQMDATVDAIEERLTPGELAHEAWSLFRGGSTSSVNRIWRIARQHPMPAAIISVGLGWMVYESARGDDQHARRRYAARYTDDDQWAAEDEPGVTRSARRRAAAAARGVTETAASAVERTGELAGQARDAATDVAESVRRQASEMGRQASQLGSETRRGMRQARAGFWNTLEDQPLVVGAAGLAAGVLVGLLLPSTPAEDEVMGETRDSLIEEVKGLGHEVLEKGKQVATAAAETLKQGAEAQGLSADAVAEKVRNVGRDVVETVKSEAQKSGGASDAPSQEPREGHQPPRHRAA